MSEKLSGAKPSIGVINQYMPLLHRSTLDFSECAVPDAEANVAELLSVIGSLFIDDVNLLAERITAGLLYEQGRLTKAYKHALAANSDIKKHFAPETKFLATSILVYVLETSRKTEQADTHIKRIADMTEQGALMLVAKMGYIVTKPLLQGG